MNETNPKSELISTLKRVGDLARNGQLSQAQDILVPLVEDKNPNIETLDMLAKIYAQQSNFTKAQALWVHALQMDPSNMHILAALKSCAIYKKPEIQQFMLRYSGLLIAVCVWWFVVIFLILLNG